MLLAWLLCLSAGFLVGCQGRRSGAAELKEIYAWVSEGAVDTRTPVVVIPGILGSKLEDRQGEKVWGAFTRGAVDPDGPEGARTFALPMELGTPLAELRDGVQATAVLDVLVADVGFFHGLSMAAYVGILTVLEVGGFRDLSLGESGAVEYGEGHYTCFQFPYDWRRDISESAALFAGFVSSTQDYVREVRGIDAREPVRIDVVAHSMGGLVLRYYLRYGAQALPADGSLPELTWEGARHVRNAILVGTPNGGSVEALDDLLTGMNLHPLFPFYRPSLLGTFPSIYQLMPRPRHRLVVDAQNEALDLYDPGLWEELGWGLVNPDIDKALAWLLPDRSEAERMQVAREHLAKCLMRAEQLHRALDLAVAPPAGTYLALFAGDGKPTLGGWTVEEDGSWEEAEEQAGDGTVTRSNALLDERQGGVWEIGLRSPIHWDRVQFLSADHLGLTSAPEFIDNMLYQLLERP